jgi:hypothetical protein
MVPPERLRPHVEAATAAAKQSDGADTLISRVEAPSQRRPIFRLEEVRQGRPGKADFGFTDAELSQTSGASLEGRPSARPGASACFKFALVPLRGA